MAASGRSDRRGSARPHLAQPGDAVEGLVIAREVDDKLDSALLVTPGVSARTYRVGFSLHPHQPPEG